MHKHELGATYTQLAPIVQPPKQHATAASEEYRRIIDRIDVRLQDYCASLCSNTPPTTSTAFGDCGRLSKLKHQLESV